MIGGSSSNNEELPPTLDSEGHNSILGKWSYVLYMFVMPTGTTGSVHWTLHAPLSSATLWRSTTFLEGPVSARIGNRTGRLVRNKGLGVARLKSGEAMGRRW
jgi:hypothetical protein